jgi:ATP-dependent Clp protease ATP-binding subunit ClpB
MTTNLGQPHFLNRDLDFKEASRRAMEDLDSTYKPEFLNRFNGRQNIVFFNRLDLPIIEKIARREIDKVNALIGARGGNISINMADEDLKAMCADKYDPAIGARGIPGYFKAEIYPAVATTMLKSPNSEGVIKVTYDKEERNIRMTAPIPRDVSAPPVGLEPVSP